jgi:hypothetical protein
LALPFINESIAPSLSHAPSKFSFVDEDETNASEDSGTDADDSVFAEEAGVSSLLADVESLQAMSEIDMAVANAVAAIAENWCLVIIGFVSSIIQLNIQNWFQTNYLFLMG